MLAFDHSTMTLAAVLAVLAGAPAFAQTVNEAAPSNGAMSQQSGKLLSKDQDARNSQLLAAAEPFEALTEQAFSATGAKLQSLIAQVDQAAHKVQGALPPNAQSELQKRLGEIKQAQHASKPDEIALAAVEGYRILVSETHETVVPKAVNLLDYAGFRYDADLKSKPIRWTDMHGAAQFAEAQWKSIEGQVTDTSLKDDFGGSLTQMAKAVSDKSDQAAQTAVTTELNLVDKLESYFSKAHVDRSTSAR